jgi:Skp family chaperone for outer membrane proteins
MASINTEKILKELDKGSILEQVDAFNSIKDHVAKNIEKAQQEAEEKANHLQNTFNRITGAQ